MAKRTHKPNLIKLLAILVVVLVAGGCWLWYRSEHSPEKIVTVGTKLIAPQQANTSTTDAKTPVGNSSGSANAGGAIDTHGSAPTPTDSSQWTSSASGIITVKSPAPSAVLKDGDTIAGSAKVDVVQYRLSDNKVGKIAQGSLNVINGNFSGTLHFQPQGTGGRLDIFSTDSQGKEYNEIQINVSY